MGHGPKWLAFGKKKDSLFAIWHSCRTEVINKLVLCIEKLGRGRWYIAAQG